MNNNEITGIYRFLSSLAITQEQLMYCKDNLIAIQRNNLNKYVENAPNRSERRRREKETTDNLKLYIAAIERLYNSANRILASIEKDKEGSEMIDAMIETLTEAVNKIELEVTE